jgi:hypothetical protein
MLEARVEKSNLLGVSWGKFPKKLVLRVRPNPLKCTKNYQE